MNKENKVVKISDVIENHIPEFLVSENPNLVEFLKQFYISQEFQSGPIDLVENLLDYKNIESFDNTNLKSETTLTQDVGYFDDTIYVESTHGWPDSYGLLKINNEIITYTQKTNTSFIGCVRGFSGIDSLHQDINKEFLNFTQSDIEEHKGPTSENNVQTPGDTVTNLSILFLLEFFKKIKYQFAPGFEEVEFSPEINAPNFISNLRSFYESKGTDSAYKILFKILFNEKVEVINPFDYTFKTSDDRWVVCETFVCEPVSGDPTKIQGQTLYQDATADNRILEANGSIYSISKFSYKEQNFYKINIFSGYSNNLNPKGAISGEFVSTPKTYLVDPTTSGSETIFVNSTIGFESSGTIFINGLEVSYSDKTNNQFLNCSGITEDIPTKTAIYGENYVYSYENGDSNLQVKLRILNVLSDLDETNARYAYNGDEFEIENLGNLKENTFTGSLLYNLPSTVYCGKIVRRLRDGKVGVGINDGVCRSNYKHHLRDKDRVDLYILNTKEVVATDVLVTVSSNQQYQFSFDTSTLNDYIGKNLIARRKLFKSNSLTYPEIQSKFIADVQDSYTDSKNNYITSNGFPRFSIEPYKREFNFTINSSDYQTLVGNHNFYDGEEISVVDFTIFGTYDNLVGINTGVSYFVKKVNESSIKLAYSKENVGLSDFLSFVELVNPPVDNTVSGYVETFRLIDNDLYANDLTSSKSLKSIPKELSSGTSPVETSPGPIGIFANGIEIQNYKSYDRIYNGKIEKINVLNPGENYDLNNPPRFAISGDTETILLPQLTGKIEEIVVKDGGYDYDNNTIPSFKILGGGSNEKLNLNVSMRALPREIDFNSSSVGGVVDTANNKFIFSSPHGLVQGEGVVYNNFNYTGVGIGSTSGDGTLSNGAIYYISGVSTAGAGTSFSLAFTKNDANQGINTINLREYGLGIHRFTTLEKKNKIESITVSNKNNNFKYKKIFCDYTGVNHYDNVFIIQNHEFNENDEVLYSYTGSQLSGISTSSYYYVKLIDENQFQIKTSKTSTSAVNFGSSNETSIHYFEYSPIRVEISSRRFKKGAVGKDAVLVPVALGSVTDVLVAKSKDGYGYSEILNFNDAPEVKELVGSQANIQVIVNNGVIQKTIIKNKGKNYYNRISLQINGTGYGAILEPVIQNGEIIDVKVLNGGLGYSSNTIVKVVPLAKGLKVSSTIQSWTVNEIDKLGVENSIKGTLLGKGYSLFGNIYGLFFLNKDICDYYGIPALRLNQSPSRHSPIVGWAYDGCPIYGPDGYKNADGTGGFKRLKSSYKEIKSASSPSTFLFVEDHQFIKGLGDLDEHNGRFCITPEYPDGVYAYFCTMDRFRAPVFPYVIGNSFKYIPDTENFNLRRNQTLDFNSLDLIKHTAYYNLENKENYYEFIDFNSKFYEKDGIVVDASSGSIDELLVAEGGSSYKIGNSISFNNEGTNGFGALGKVSELQGVGINSITSETSTLSDVPFTYSSGRVYGYVSDATSLVGDSFVNISSISTSGYSSLKGYHKINLVNKNSSLIATLPNYATTGITTSIQIDKAISSFEIGDTFMLESETLTVIGLDYDNNLINVLRESGSPSYSIGEPLVPISNKFYFESNKKLDLPKTNTSYYFNPSQSVSSGFDLTQTNLLTIYPLGPGIEKIKDVKCGLIYLPNHKFVTGDKIVYTTDGLPLETQESYNLNDTSYYPNLFVIRVSSDLIGLVSEKNKTKSIDQILLYKTSSIEDNQLHKFTTDRNFVTADVSFNETTVYTKKAHDLSVGDKVYLTVKSGITTTFDVTYSSANAKLLINSEENPKINVYENDVVVFDLSSATLINCDFNLYSDPEFNNIYEGNQKNGLEVVKDSNSLTLTISDNTPKILYYNLTSDVEDIFIDSTVSRNNTIIIDESFYSNKVLGITTHTNSNFIINYPGTPERPSYGSTTSELNYFVTSSTTYFGPISKASLLSKGKDYEKLPSVEILSDSGENADIIPLSNRIGKIQKSKIINNQFILPTDKTLKPYSSLYSNLFVYDNYTVSGISISSGGAGYLQSPTISLYSKNKGKLIDSFSAVSQIKNGSVQDIVVTSPGYGLESTDTKIVFLNNTNGIDVINASYNSGTDTATLTLKTPSTGFTTSNPLRIKVGDKIFVEDVVSIKTVGATTSLYDGYNCSANDYEYFTVVGVNTAYGSKDAATVSYSIDYDPGSYSSSGSLVRSKDIPNVTVSLGKNVFLPSEKIKDKNASVLDNPKNAPIQTNIKVSNSDQIELEEVIKGKISNSKGTVKRIETYSSTFNAKTSVSTEIGWKSNRGNTSEILQKLQDNDYYQLFSYALKSKVQMSDWESIAYEVSHIAGFKLFGDMVIESKQDQPLQYTPVDSSITNISLSSYADVNTKYDFDLCTENVDDYNGSASDIINLNSKIISDYIVSKDNRVLSIDDISNLFDTDVDPFPVNPFQIDTAPVYGAKYMFFVQASATFLGNYEYPMFFESFVTKDGDNVSITTYSVDDDNNMGTILGDVDSNDYIIVSFLPKIPSVSYSVRAIREDFNLSGITTNYYGNNRNVGLTTTYFAEETPTQKTIYSVPISSVSGGTLFVGISDSSGSIRDYKEMTFLYDNGIVSRNIYTENIIVGLGSIGISTSGSNLIVTYDGIPDTEVTVYTNMNFIHNTTINPQEQEADFTRLNSGIVTFTGTALSDQEISRFSSYYSASKYVMLIEKTVGVTTTKSIVSVNMIHYFADFYMKDITYGHLGDVDDINFVTSYDSLNDEYVVSFTPSENADYVIKFFEKNISSAQI